MDFWHTTLRSAIRRPYVDWRQAEAHMRHCALQYYIYIRPGKDYPNFH